jgi:ElaB/YqjD/DUF883 family membrane-anchored ribosome-binding protein
VARVPVRMVRVRIASLAVPAIAMIAAGAGCGSGEEEVSEAELRQKADSICREEQARFDRIQAHAPANASIAADQTKELIGVAGSASAELGDLEPPESLADAYDRYLEARDRAVGEMKRGQEAAENRDSAGYAAAQTSVAKGAPERRRLAGAVGLRVCGANPRSA